LSYGDIGPKAQIVNNYELGFRGASGPLRMSIAGFVSTSDDGVNFDPATNRITQQKEIIYGMEATGSWTVNQSLTFGTVLRVQEGRYDSNKDGVIDAYLPNNRIGAPFRGLLSADYRFDNGVLLRVEGEGFSGRDRPIDTAGTRYKLEPAAVFNASLAIPWRGSTFYLAANNIFDTAYENPTATSVRNLPVYSWGRTISAGMRTSF
jgi:iron complex outermembrane receptor protein